MLPVVFAVLFLSSCFLLKNEKLDQETTLYLNALIAGDAETLAAMTHPDYTDSLVDPEAVLSSLAEDGAALAGSLSELSPHGRSYAGFNSGYGGATTGSTYRAVIGEEA